MDTQSAPLVEARNLAVHYRVERGTALRRSTAILKALDNVSVAIEAGETLGIVGESGCGKTTLGRTLVGLNDPTSGEIWYGGNRVDHLRGNARQALCRNRQIVFQDPYASLDPRWKIGDTLEEPLRIHAIVPKAERRAEVNRLLESVGLAPDTASRYPHEFSGGQRQRIGIARALAVRPQFLVADEPVSALDVSVRAQILNLLTSIQRDIGIATLFITHDLGAVRFVSNRIAVMYLGIIVEECATDELFENPRHPYTRTLLDAVPRAFSDIAKPLVNRPIGDDIPSPLDLPTGCRFRTRCRFAQAICAESEPPLSPVAGEVAHRSACHFAADLPVYKG